MHVEIGSRAVTSWSWTSHSATMYYCKLSTNWTCPMMCLRTAQNDSHLSYCQKNVSESSKGYGILYCAFYAVLSTPTCAYLIYIKCWQNYAGGTQQQPFNMTACMARTATAIDAFWKPSMKCVFGQSASNWQYDTTCFDTIYSSWPPQSVS